MVLSSNRSASSVVKKVLVGDVNMISPYSVLRRNIGYSRYSVRSFSCRFLKNPARLRPFCANRFSTCQPNEDNKNDKHEQPAKKIDFLKQWAGSVSKLSGTYYDYSGSMAKVLNSLHVELPKNFPNVKDYMRVLYGRFSSSQITQEPKLIEPEFLSASNSKNKELNTVQTLPKAANLGKDDLMYITSSNDLVSTGGAQAVVDQPQKIVEPEVATKSRTLTDHVVSTASGAVTSTMNAMKVLSNYLPNAAAVSQKISPAARADKSFPEEPKKKLPTITTECMGTRVKMRVQRDKIDSATIDRETRFLTHKLRIVQSDEVKTELLRELNKYLIVLPRAQSVAVKDGLVKTLMTLRKSDNEELRNEVERSLSLAGFVDPLESEGIRVLSLDGGGTRALITLEILKELERRTGKPLYELFDYVCGVSTGALLAVVSCVFGRSLTFTEQLYKKFSKVMFDKGRIYGMKDLFMSHAYYDTEKWEEILRTNIKDVSFLDTMSNRKIPKFSLVSTVMNVGNVQNFLFRNYNLPAGRQSKFLGSVEHRLWEAIRASSAAPGYFEEMELGGYVHQDGGLMTNNPTGVALQECQLLWPNEDIQCIVSIGTGIFTTTKRALPAPSSKTSLADKFVKVIESATDTEGIHMTLHNLLQPSTYFRFNPHTSERFTLDEINEEKWHQMQRDSAMYVRKNEVQLNAAAQQLMLRKSKLTVAKNKLLESVRMRSGC